VKFSGVTVPTLEQQLMIAAGCSKFPSTPSHNRFSSEVSHYFQQQEDGSYQISHHQDHFLSGFINIRLMRGNKQTHKEAVELLYGGKKNTFVFNTEDLQAQSVLNDEPDCIPGLPRIDQDGNRQFPSDSEISDAIQKLFTRTIHHPHFIWHDHLTHFLTRIGPTNAKLLRKIKFNGIFKTGGLANQFGMLGFLELLPIYTTILNHACPNLKKLTLHLGTEGQYVNPRFDGDTAKTDEELIEDVIKTLVEGLPGLQRLVFGDYEVLGMSTVNLSGTLSR
jgi:hypothetical protein